MTQAAKQLLQRLWRERSMHLLCNYITHRISLLQKLPVDTPPQSRQSVHAHCRLPLKYMMNRRFIVLSWKMEVAKGESNDYP